MIDLNSELPGSSIPESAVAGHGGKKGQHRILGNPEEGREFVDDLRSRGYLLILVHREDGERMMKAADAIDRLVKALESE